MRKLLVCTPLGIFSAFRYIFYIFLNDYNFSTFQDINFNFSAFLSLVDAEPGSVGVKTRKIRKAQYTSYI